MDLSWLVNGDSWRLGMTVVWTVLVESGLIWLIIPVYLALVFHYTKRLILWRQNRKYIYGRTLR